MKHAKEVWDIYEGSTVTIETTDGIEFDATCTSRETEYSDPRSEHIRETTMWEFSAVEWSPVVDIVNGVRSSEDDPEFPLHSELWCTDHEQDLGYIESITIHE